MHAKLQVARLDTLYIPDYSIYFDSCLSLVNILISVNMTSYLLAIWYMKRFLSCSK